MTGTDIDSVEAGPFGKNCCTDIVLHELLCLLVCYNAERVLFQNGVFIGAYPQVPAVRVAISSGVRQLRDDEGRALRVHGAQQTGKLLCRFLVQPKLAGRGLSFLVYGDGFHPDHAAAALRECGISRKGMHAGSAGVLRVPAFDRLREEAVFDGLPADRQGRGKAGSVLAAGNPICERCGVAGKSLL